MCVIIVYSFHIINMHYVYNNQEADAQIQSTPEIPPSSEYSAERASKA